MEITLMPDRQDYVKELVDRGEFSTASDVVQTALLRWARAFLRVMQPR